MREDGGIVMVGRLGGGWWHSNPSALEGQKKMTTVFFLGYLAVIAVRKNAVLAALGGGRVVGELMICTFDKIFRHFQSTKVRRQYNRSQVRPKYNRSLADPTYVIRAAR